MQSALGSSFIVSGLEAMFFILTILFCIHAAVLAYHWFTYGKRRESAWSALTTYLIGGSLLLLSMAGAIYFV